MATTTIDPTCYVCGGALPLAADDKAQPKVVLIKPSVALSGKYRSRWQNDRKDGPTPLLNKEGKLRVGHAGNKAMACCPGCSNNVLQAIEILKEQHNG